MHVAAIIIGWALFGGLVISAIADAHGMGVAIFGYIGICFIMAQQISAARPKPETGE